MGNKNIYNNENVNLKREKEVYQGNYLINIDNYIQ